MSVVGQLLDREQGAGAKNKEQAAGPYLQTKALGHVLVLAVHGLHLDVVLERILQRLQSLDVELDVCRAAQGQRGRTQVSMLPRRWHGCARPSAAP